MNPNDNELNCSYSYSTRQITSEVVINHNRVVIIILLLAPPLIDTCRFVLRFGGFFRLVWKVICANRTSLLGDKNEIDDTIIAMWRRPLILYTRVRGPRLSDPVELARRPGTCPRPLRPVRSGPSAYKKHSRAHVSSTAEIIVLVVFISDRYDSSSWTVIVVDRRKSRALSVTEVV